MLDGISDAEASVLPEGEKWSIQQIVEHVAMVEFGTSRICGRLVEGARADAKPSDGSFSLTPNFLGRAAEIAMLKVEAPERVQPTGRVKIDGAFEMMAQNRTALAALRSDLEQFDLSGHTFPHPFFGPLTAAEWLAMAGMHEQRHTKQIEKVLEKVRRATTGTGQ